MASPQKRVCTPWITCVTTAHALHPQGSALAAIAKEQERRDDALRYKATNALAASRARHAHHWSLQQRVRHDTIQTLVVRMRVPHLRSAPAIDHNCYCCLASYSQAQTEALLARERSKVLTAQTYFAGKFCSSDAAHES